MTKWQLYLDGDITDRDLGIYSEIEGWIRRNVGKKLDFITLPELDKYIGSDRWIDVIYGLTDEPRKMKVVFSKPKFPNDCTAEPSEITESEFFKLLQTNGYGSEA